MAELFVSNFDPALGPGAYVDVVMQGTPGRIIVAGAPLQQTRWRAAGPFSSPKYPAEGFVALSLAENQWETINELAKMHEIMIIKHGNRGDGNH